MSSVQVLPLGNYPTGPFGPFGPIDIADEVTAVDFSCARCTTLAPATWPNVTTTLDVVPEISVDGGQTWSECGRFGSVGGIAFDHHGNEQPFCRGGGSLPVAPGRKYRVSGVIGGGPLRTSVTVEIS